MYVNVGDSRIYYEQAGSGKPLLLLHGWGVSSEIFRPLLYRLAGGRTVFSIDFPGFGLSDAPPHGWGTEEYAETVNGLLQELGVESTDVIAHSFGARVALRLARKYPRRVGRLILTGAAGIRSPKKVPAHKKMAAKLAKAAGMLGGPGRWLKEKIYSIIGSADYLSAGEMREVLVRVVNEDLTSLLPHIKHETLLIWGDRDEQTPLSDGRKMNAGLSNSRMEIMDGVGHYPFIDRPDEFYALVSDFLKPGQ